MDSIWIPIKRSLAGAGLWPFASRQRRMVDELDVREAYRLWAPTYAAETVATFLDDELAYEMLHGLPQTQLLDAGCGIGRRIAGHSRSCGD